MQLRSEIQVELLSVSDLIALCGFFLCIAYTVAFIFSLWYWVSESLAKVSCFFNKTRRWCGAAYFLHHSLKTRCPVHGARWVAQLTFHLQPCMKKAQLWLLCCFSFESWHLINTAFFAAHNIPSLMDNVLNIICEPSQLLWSDVVVT